MTADTGSPSGSQVGYLAVYLLPGEITRSMSILSMVFFVDTGTVLFEPG